MLPLFDLYSVGYLSLNQLKKWSSIVLPLHGTPVTESKSPSQIMFTHELIPVALFVKINEVERQ